MVRGGSLPQVTLGGAEHAQAVLRPFGALGALALRVGDRPRDAVGNHELVDAALGADQGLQAHAALLGRDAHPRAGAGEVVFEAPAAEPAAKRASILRRRGAVCGGGCVLRERAAGRQASRQEEVCSS